MFDDSNEGINFWPAFADSMLAVILLLLLVVGATYLKLGEPIKKAQDCQAQFAEGVHAMTEATAGATQKVWTVVAPGSLKKLITLQEDPRDSLLLHITFSDAALGFQECDDKLDETGQNALSDIATEILHQSKSIVEIQIQGHADRRKPTGCVLYKDNLHLASARADQVFEFLEAQGVSPLQVAMSAASYGEYFPARRAVGEEYSPEKWEADNATAGKMQENRRVELILRYGTGMKSCQGGN